MAKINRSEKQSATNQEAIGSEILLMMNIADIETKMAVDPNHCRFAQLADSYLMSGDIDEAIRLCETGRKKFPHYGTAALVLSKAFRMKGDRQKAIAEIQDYLNIHPASLVAHKIMGDLALEEGNLRKAVKHFRIALRIDPVNRDLIQQFVEVRDEFQKIKHTLPAEEDESDDVKPVINKTALPGALPEKTIDRVLDEVLEMPSSFKETAIDMKEKKSLIEEPSAEPFMMETEPVAEIPEAPVLEEATYSTPADEKIITKETQDLLPDDETEPIPPAVVKPVGGDMNPVFVDEKGVMYFYDDDEVSFDQYKKRFDLQKQGKAKIMNRARLDERLALMGIATSRKTEISDKERLEQSVDDAFAQFKPEPVIEPAAETQSAETAEEIKMEEEISLVQPTDDIDVYEEESAFEDIEISYKDYLDILTEEEELLEALMGEVPQESVTEEIAADLVAKLVRSTEDEAPIPAILEDEPITYTGYLSSLTDTIDIEEANFPEIPRKDIEEEQRILSLAEFAEELDFQDELIDFQTYQLLSPPATIEDFFAETEKPAEMAETAISYGDYLESLEPEEDRKEALFEEMIQEPVQTVEDFVEEETAPVIETIAETTKQPEPAEVLKPAEPVTEISREETPVAIIEKPAEPISAVEQKTEPLRETAVAEAVTEEETEEGEEEDEEEFDVEEEIDPRKASLELVDQLAQFGQFGAAYKVCKMLKLKNPTDAKVDRKILELKRLYLWSSQLVG